MKKFLVILSLVMMIAIGLPMIHAVSSEKTAQSKCALNNETSVLLSSEQTLTRRESSASMPVEVKIIIGIVFAIFALITILPVVFNESSSFASMGLLPAGTSKYGLPENRPG